MMGRVATAARHLQQRVLTAAAPSHIKSPPLVVAVSSSTIHHNHSPIILTNKLSFTRNHSLLPTQLQVVPPQASSPAFIVRHFSTPPQPPSSNTDTPTNKTATDEPLPDDTPPPTNTPASTVPSTTVLDTSTLLDAFRDPLGRGERLDHAVGRSWHARELRRKSYEDLHKLWYVLYKERNMLMTEQHLARRHQLQFPQPERLRKVRKSMGAIKQVLGERKRSKIAACAERQEQAMMMDMMDMMDDEDEGNDQVDDKGEGDDTTTMETDEQTVEDKQPETPNKDPKS